MLFADGEQQLSLLGREISAAASIAAWRRTQRIQAAGLVRVVPALERRDRIRFRGTRTWRAEALLGELTAIELAAR